MAEQAAAIVPPRILSQATLVVPRTGQRVKRSFTLRDPSVFYRQAATSPEREPLLPKHNTLSELSDGIFKQPSSIFGQLLWRAYEDVKQFVLSREGQGVFKCSLAYFLSSLAVFVRAFTPILGSGDSKHLVANILIWFHPARTFGSMVQAAFYAFIAWIYAAFVSYLSMSIATFFATQDMLPVGHAILLIVCCGGGLGLVAWMKQLLENDLLVNLACSLAAIPITTVLTKDRATQDGYYSHNTVSQVLRMMIMAILISVAVNLLVKPIFARNNLRQALVDTTDGLSDLVAGITSSFLTGSEGDMEHPAVTTASERISSALGSLEETLVEARNEHYVLGTERQYWIESLLVHCCQRLAQDIGGLRSAATTQFALLNEGSYSETRSQPMSVDGGLNSRQGSIMLAASIASTSTLSTIMDGGDGAGNVPYNASPTFTSMPSSSSQRPKQEFSVASSAEIFALFIENLGPPMKSLAFTLKQILKELPFGPAPNFESTLHPNFRSSLYDAIQLFNSSRKQALKLVYRSKQISVAQSTSVAADFEEVAASCGHFTSSLADLAETCLLYLDILHELENEVKNRPRGRSWRWLRFWGSPELFGLEKMLDAYPSMRRTTDFQVYMPSIGTRKYYNKIDHSESGIKKTLRFRIWKSLRVFRRDDVKFSIKVGLGAVAISVLAYIPMTQPFFYHWRLEWCLATYMFVCNMTVGAANGRILPRLIGTGIGALLAIAGWVASDDNPYILAFLGWVVSLGCFFVMLVLEQGPMSRFMLLTYNLSVLYSYSLSIDDLDDDDDEGGVNPQIWDIVLHRLIAVSLGIIWGLFITQAVWPISARRKFKAGLSLLWLRMSLIWKRGPFSILIDNDLKPSYLSITEELKLRAFCEALNTLRENAESEFMLRGPFPTESYDLLLRCTRRMLDHFHGLSVVIARETKATPGEAEILRYTSNEREQLARRVSHLFSVLASSVKLEYPLNDVLPDITHTRDRLLAKVYRFRQDAEKRELTTDEDFELLYCYALVTGQIGNEIGTASREIGKLFGTLDEDILMLR